MSQPNLLSTTSVTLLTPVGRGALATVAVEGEAAGDLVARRFRPISRRPLDSVPLQRIVFGHWAHADGQTEEVVVCRKTASRIEVHGHGGPAAAESIISSLVQLGAQRGNSMDWIRRHTSDAIEAAALQALAHARTERVAAILLDQYRGALRQSLARLAARLEAGDRVGSAHHLGRLLRLSAVGRHLITPWRVVCAGPPNVGKSSLVNALLGFQRTIVLDLPGTTRDVVVASTAFDGWPIELCDTAGLRDTEDPVEREGVARTEQAKQTADLVLFVLDAQQEWFPEYRDQLRDQNTLVVANKIDLLPNPADVDWVWAKAPNCLGVSALEGTGIAELISAIVDRLVPDAANSGEGVPFCESQIELVERVQALHAAGDFAAAAASIHDFQTEVRRQP